MPTEAFRQSGRGGGWLIGGAIALAVAAAALVYALRQPPTGREKPGGIASRRAPATAVAGPAPAATATPDELVIAAPRILEDATPTALPKSNATRTPVPAPIPPTIAPPPPPPTAAVASNGAASNGRVEVPGMGELTPRKMRRLMEDWKSRPLDRRGFLAVRTAYIANLFVRGAPDDPLSAEIRERLPRALREDSDTALNGNPKRPAVAFEFATAYLQLTFAPKDPEMERRVAELGTHLKRGRRGQGGE